MLIVPLIPAPKQNLSITLDGQQVEINLRQLRYGMFIDVYLGGTAIASNVVCENLNAIIRAPYLGFAGDLAFYDTQGASDPDYSGLGDGGRFQLFYLTAAEIAAFAATPVS
jgi:hypothetical protein